MGDFPPASGEGRRGEGGGRRGVERLLEPLVAIRRRGDEKSAKTGSANRVPGSVSLLFQLPYA